MPRSRGRPLLPAVLGLAVLAALLADPSPARAGLPEEPPAEWLPGSTSGLLGVDVDDDGAREVVRLTSPAGTAVVFVEVWDAADGSWERVGSPTAVERLTDPEVGRLLDAQSPLGRRLPQPVGAPTRLLAWRQGGVERALVVAVPPGSAREVPCCATILLVDAGTGELALQPVGEVTGRIDSAVALDVDGDGTDELLVSEPPVPGDPHPYTHIVLRLFRWTDGGFAAAGSAEIRRARWMPLFVLGDSDGLPGEEAGFVTGWQARTLTRIAAGPDGLVIDDFARTTYPDAFSAPMRVAAVPTGSGPGLVINDQGETIVARWPRGEPLTVLHRTSVRGQLVGVAGERSQTRIVLAGVDGAAGGMTVLDRRLRREATAEPSAAASAAIDAGLLPYAGELPGGLDGAPATWYRGRLVTGGSDAPGLEVATLAGARPAGTVGVDNAELIVVHGAQLPLGRSGGALGAPEEGARVAIVPLTTALHPEPDVLRPFPLIRGAPSPDGDDRYLAPADGMRLGLSAPPGTRVVAQTVSLSPSGERAVAGDVPASGFLDLAIPLPTAVDEFGLSLAAVTPVGHAYAERWHVDVRAEPPGLEASAPTLPLTAHVEVAGRTDPDATLLVDGDAVPLATDGSFTVPVDASLVPRDVRVTVVDPVGNRAERAVSVVAFINYPRLPWVPAAAAAILLAAALLAWRDARRAARPVPVRGGEGTLEEF